MTGPTLLRDWVALLLVGAAAIHVAVLPEHLAESTLAGAFFAAVAAAQLVWAVEVLRRHDRGLFVVVGAANLGIALVWLASRTVGLPVGLHPGAPEEVDALGVAASAAEVATLVLAIALTRPAPVSGSESLNWTAAWRPLALALVAATVFSTGSVATASWSQAAHLAADGRGGEADSHGVDAPDIPDEAISAVEFEQATGIRLDRLVVTAGGGLLDVRFTVLDDHKASESLGDGDVVAVREPETGAVLATEWMGHVHENVTYREDLTYYRLIRNSGGVVVPGSTVTLVFGDFRVDGLAVG